MGFLGLACVYMMRINLSVAIVDMVKTSHHPSPIANESFANFISDETSPSSVDLCPVVNSTVEVEDVNASIN